MKKLNILLIGILVTILFACSGSDVYRGSWKAMDTNGGKFEIIFDAKNFAIKDSVGREIKFK